MRKTTYTVRVMAKYSSSEVIGFDASVTLSNDSEYLVDNDVVDVVAELVDIALEKEPSIIEIKVFPDGSLADGD